MGLQEVTQVSTGGPDGGSAWDLSGCSVNIAQISATTTQQIIGAYTVDPRDLALADGSYPSSVQMLGRLEPQPIARLMGARFTAQADGVAASNLSFGVSVARNVGTLGAQVTGTITSITLAAGLTQPLASGQAVRISNGTTATVFVLSAVANAGATTLAVTSKASGATYAVGTNVTCTPIADTAANSGVVCALGKSPVFGWLASGAGTPAFTVGSAVSLPALAAANTNDTTIGTATWLVLYPNDTLFVTAITSSATATVPAGIVTLNIT